MFVVPFYSLTDSIIDATTFIDYSVKEAFFAALLHARGLAQHSPERASSHFFQSRSRTQNLFCLYQTQTDTQTRNTSAETKPPTSHPPPHGGKKLRCCCEHARYRAGATCNFLPHPTTQNAGAPRETTQRQNHAPRLIPPSTLSPRLRRRVASGSQPI